MQTIHIRRESESNEILEYLSGNFAIVYVYFLEDSEVGERYPLLATINETGETIFTHEQMPQMISELEGLDQEFQDKEVSPVIKNLIADAKNVKPGMQLRCIAE